jgi:hypothetical protein
VSRPAGRDHWRPEAPVVFCSCLWARASCEGLFVGCYQDASILKNIDFAW